MKRLALLFLIVYVAACSGTVGTLGTLQLGGSNATQGGGGGGGGGSGGGGSGSGLIITTASLADCTVGLACTQNLAASGGTGPYTFSKVSEFPNTDFWNYVNPAGTASGTPQYAETEQVTYLVTDSGGNTNFKTFSFKTVASGALSIITPTTLPAATLKGAYLVRLLASGGIPPYHWTSPGLAKPCLLTFQGWLECTPTATGTTNIPVTVTDNNGATANETVSFTTGTSLQLGRVDPVDNVIHLPPVEANNPVRAVINAYGGLPAYTYTATGLPSWASIQSSTGTITGTPTVPGNVSFTIHVTDSQSNTVSATAIENIGPSNIVQRPAYNSAVANGFFVLNGQLYDPNGHHFHVRGTNNLHSGNGMQSFTHNTGLNTVRIWGDTNNLTTLTSLANTYIANGTLVDISQGYFPNGAGGVSGNNSVTDLDALTAWWVSNKASFAPIMAKMMLNIGNEWGKSGTDAAGNTLTVAQWAAAYESEIPKLRAGGWTCPIVIDAYGQGENLNSLTQYGPAIINSDPEKNVILAWHGYQTERHDEARIASVTTGATTKIFLESNAPSAPISGGGYYIYNAQGLTTLNGAWSGNNTTGTAGSYSITLNANSSSWTGSYVPNSATVVVDNDTQNQGRGDAHYNRAGDIIVSSGLPIMMEEFASSGLDSPGPYQIVNGSDATTGQTISGFENYGAIGWLNWAWDDNGSPSNPWAWFDYIFCTNACSSTAYTGDPTVLNPQGIDLILNSRYSFNALGSPAASLQ